MTYSTTELIYTREDIELNRPILHLHFQSDAKSANNITLI